MALIAVDEGSGRSVREGMSEKLSGDAGELPKVIHPDPTAGTKGSPLEYTNE